MTNLIFVIALALAASQANSQDQPYDPDYFPIPGFRPRIECPGPHCMTRSSEPHSPHHVRLDRLGDRCPGPKCVYPLRSAWYTGRRWKRSKDYSQDSDLSLNPQARRMRSAGGSPTAGLRVDIKCTGAGCIINRSSQPHSKRLGDLEVVVNK